MMEFHVDGSGWNGANCAYCVCQNKKKKYLKVLYEERSAIDMEYIALIKALTEATKGDTIYTDSQNMVNQILYDKPAKEESTKDLKSGAKMLVDAKKIKLIWISRAQNIAGHILEERLKKLREHKRAVVSPKKKEDSQTGNEKKGTGFLEEDLEKEEGGRRNIIRITPHMEIIRHCRKIVENTSLGNRGDFDGDFYQQLFGLVAQTIVCWLLEIEWPKGLPGFDGGYDIVWKDLKWDVKCEIRRAEFKQDYVHNLSANQAHYEVDGYIFVSYNRIRNEYEICGFVSKENLMKKARYFKEGQTRTRKDGTLMKIQSRKGMYELDQEHLTKFKE